MLPIKESIFSRYTGNILMNISMRDFLNRIGATDVLFGLSISGSYTYSHINTIGQIKG